MIKLDVVDIIDLSDKAAKAIVKTVECLYSHVEDFKVECISYEDFKFKVDCTIRPAHTLRCMEIHMPNYRARCLKTLRARRRYFNFNSKWKTRYDFGSRSKYIIKRR